MEKNASAASSVEAYIVQFPAEIQEILQTMRAVIREEAPEAQEKISYQMPTFYLHGNLVHFGAFKHHIGFYPAPSGIEAFQERLSAYKGAKGSIQFPLDKPIPYDLVRDIVRYRLEENTRLAVEKKRRK